MRKPNFLLSLKVTFSQFLYVKNIIFIGEEHHSSRSGTQAGGNSVVVVESVFMHTIGVCLMIWTRSALVITHHLFEHWRIMCVFKHIVGGYVKM